MRDLRRGLWLIACGISLFVAAQCLADEKGDVRGCYITYLSGSGKFLYEPFLKVADKESTSEDDEPEIWGFRVWNLEPPDKQGKTHPVNISDGRFIPTGVFKLVRAGTVQKNVRCPDGLW